MTDNHPVWNQQDRDAGRTALLKLGRAPAERAAKAPTSRERAYLAAVEVLYGSGPKARRDTLYATEMEQLARAHPADDEARLFYALSLLGLSQGERNVPTYLHAAAIAESVFARNPRHPGASHYLIHAVDDPDHAAMGLAAARALARSSPDADHAQHMTSHIFVALGRWDDVVAANETAMAVVNEMWRRRHRSPVFCGHYNVWLDYGYVQQGRLEDATRLLTHCREQAPAEQTDTEDLDPDAYSFLTMWSHYLIAAEDWSGSVAHWTVHPGAGLGSRLVYWFTEGLGAARRGEFTGARAALAEFAQAQRETEAWAGGSPDQPELERARVLRGELEGLIAAGEGNVDGALARLREACIVEDSMAYSFGPPFVNQPSHELLGAELLRLHRFRDAVTQFRIALRRTPRRTAALLGLAHAATAVGDAALAHQTYEELVSIWRHADPGQSAVAEATAYLRRYGH
ncbi:MAG TPA: hypothetical protein VGV12_13590 [Gemmatimonadales bacterium]|nr:hypothetical protein [Gemmatimonadales bacterium]